MAKLLISDSCIGCGLCIGSCPSEALKLEGGRAAVDPDRCILCGLCFESCPVGAISPADKEKRSFDSYNGVWVFIEQAGGKPLAVGFELLNKGRELADSKGTSLTALFFGPGVSGVAGELIAGGADSVILCDDVSLSNNLELPYTALISGLIEARRPDILLFGATAFGRSLAPRVAARVRTGLTADCTELGIDPKSGLLLQTRPAFGGNLMATIVTEHARPQMATVRPGVFPAGKPDPGRKGTVTFAEAPRSDERVQLLKTRPEDAAAGISDAEIIVSAGKGIGSQKNLKLVRQFAELIGGELGVTRPLVDMGWSEYRRQIGQTGTSVSPKLLITLGVSGAIQHLAGIGGAETVIAVNADPDAPIFTRADYKIVGDCVEILKELIKQFSK